MCRNIKPLFNFDPPATDEEIREASLQFVRKLSGFNKPSGVNAKAFAKAVEKITKDTTALINSLMTNAKKRNRKEETKRRRLPYTKKRLLTG